ncbi:MAG TPA: hypothetical protein PK006_09365 [Saprospiraceae bacterium]|nr:hypothetical protein [Saprospiraceae bacterium]
MISTWNAQAVWSLKDLLVIVVSMFDYFYIVLSLYDHKGYQIISG